MARFGATALLGAGGVVALSVGLLQGGPLQVALATGLYLGATLVAGAFMRRSYPHGALGLCNIVTLVRLVLVAALIVPVLAGGSAQWSIFWLAAAALSLDAVDGWFARRQRLTSAFGARFDMEVDAALGLILACNAFAAGTVGPLVLLLGLPRYAFGLAGLILPWMTRPLPDRFGRKLACVIQIGALVGVQPAILPPTVAEGAILVAALALAGSFGRDILWLWQRRR